MDWSKVVRDNIVSPATRSAKEGTDVHVHLAALPDGDNGCHVSRRIMRNPVFRFLVRTQGLDLRAAGPANTRYVERLRGVLERSEKIKQAVLLGLDGVYDAGGRLDLAKTDFVVSNDYVHRVARRYPEYFLPGVSINPQRRDAIEALEKSVEQGAVLVKVIPNSQHFDPSDKRYVPFYRALAKHRIPLLSHVGYELALPGTNQSMGEPSRLRRALDEGACVIAAHGCSKGLLLAEPYFKVFLELANTYKYFFADTSALTLPNRVCALFLLRRHPELHDRLIFGTDYPLPVFAYPCIGRAYREAAKTTNPFDRHALVLQSLDIRFNDFVFLRELMVNQRPPGL